MQHGIIFRWASQYEQGIRWIVSKCPNPDKFAHTYVGMALWLAVALILRRRLSSWAPLAAVLIAELANECVDRIAHGSWMWHDTLGDIAATMFWPTVLALAFRGLPGLTRTARED